MNKGTVVTEYYFILLDTNMVPITYYLTKNIPKKKSGCDDLARKMAAVGARALRLVAVASKRSKK